MGGLLARRCGFVAGNAPVQMGWADCLLSSLGWRLGRSLPVDFKYGVVLGVLVHLGPTTVEVAGEDIPLRRRPACVRTGDGGSLAFGSAIVHGTSDGRLSSFFLACYYLALGSGTDARPSIPLTLGPGSGSG